MYQFIETLKVESGKVFHLDWHQSRLNDTYLQFFPGSKPWDLQELINDVEFDKLGLYKLRIVYNDLDYQISLQPYERKEVKFFECVEVDFLYNYKFLDRAPVEAIVKGSNADEVIFTKHGKLLDASYANIALYDGELWWTPSTYLLNGTTRQRLLFEKKIREKAIHAHDIHSYKSISFINALNDLGDRAIHINI